MRRRPRASHAAGEARAFGPLGAGHFVQFVPSARLDGDAPFPERGAVGPLAMRFSVDSIA